MALMEGVQKIGGVWKVRRRIPADCAAAFDAKQFYTRSLGTSDRKLAIQLAAPILAEFDARIDAIRSGNDASDRSAPKATPLVPLDRSRAFDLIARWRRSSIKEASAKAWSGILPSLTNDEAVALSSLRAKLRANVTPEGFEEKFAAVLSVPVEHPVLRRQELRQAFLSAWSDVEDATDDFRNDRFEEWEGEETAPSAPSNPSPLSAGVTLLEAFDLWAKTKKLEPRQRGYVERLSQFLGDPDIADVKPLELDRFLLELRKWPNTKRDLSAMSFQEAIAWAETLPDCKRLHIKTVYNWTVTYKALFDFCVQRDLIVKNPAANMMRKPSAEESNERDPYEPEDLAVIFGAPLFQGNNGKGLRDTPGPTVVRDHRYWLPILAHYTGARVEELASLTVDEIKIEGGIPYIDLTERPLSGERRVKNRNARRVIPLHDGLIGLGFLHHVEDAGSGMVFPELEGEGKASENFTKWWGRWCERTAPIKGQGIDDPAKTFHSFRHSWKRAARQTADVKEEIHDLLSGHAGGNGIARGYGRGVDLNTLRDAMNAVNLPALDML